MLCQHASHIVKASTSRRRPTQNRNIQRAHSHTNARTRVANSGNATSSTAAALNDPQLSAQWSGVAEDTRQTCSADVEEDVFVAGASAPSRVPVNIFADRSAAEALSIVIPKLQLVRAPSGRQPWARIKNEMIFGLSVCTLRRSAASSSAGEQLTRRIGVPHTTAIPTTYSGSSSLSMSLSLSTESYLDVVESICGV